MSGAGNGDTVSIGLLEYRDVVGSVRYAKSRPDTGSMTTFLLSVCLGADSTCVAMARHPEEEKKLAWIEGTTRRFDGYNYFGEHPEVAVEWFESHAA